MAWLQGYAAIQIVDDTFINATNVSKAEFCPHNLTDPVNSGWVFTVFGECVTNIRQWFAFWIGLSSILCWLFAQVPQLVKNCMTGKGDQALSFWFLFAWLLGDTTNLIGAILARQLTTQIVTAVYFVIIDGITMSQFLYYVVKNQGVKGLLNCCKFRSKPQVLMGLLPGVAFTLLLASTSPGLRGDPYQSGPRIGRTLKHLNFRYVVNIHDARDVAGYILGCISAMFYVVSRVPQLVKNCRRCSVEGLSPVMFVLAIMGNATYGLGIFLYSVDPIFLLQKLPWLVGSVGTLVFDFMIVAQFMISLCGKYIPRLCRYIQRGGDREPLLDTASSASDSEAARRDILKEEHVFRARSLSPEGGLSRYKNSVQ